MKKNLSAYALAAGASLLFVAGASAQSFSNSIKFSVPAEASAAVPADSQALQLIKQSSEKTYKNFTKKFPYAANLKVRPERGGTHITFSKDGVVTRTLYNAKGRQMYSTRSFPVTDLPKNVIQHVEYYFPGYTVYGHVTEVKVNSKTAQLILIENMKTWKRVRLIDGELDVYEEHTKSL